MTLMLSTAIALGSVSAAYADDAVVSTPDQGHGSISFAGAVLDSPCSIASASLDQTVDMGQISNVSLQAEEGKGRSVPQNFQINLEGCSLATAASVTALFTGAAGKQGRLGVTGEHKGASVVIADGSGTAIELGKPTAAQALQNGNNTLLFSAYLQGDGDADAIVPGSFKGVLDFSLAYQ